MKKIAAAIALVSLMAMSAGAQAAGCYTEREFEAEQGLRIHSELMVIGLTCLRMPGGEQLYRKYGRFTQKNQGLIAQYESDLISYYSGQGGGGAEKRLHTLRTNLANGISKHVISMGTGSFCQHFAPRIDRALSMDQQSLRRWARHTWPGSPVSQPICAKF